MLKQATLKNIFLALYENFLANSFKRAAKKLHRNQILTLEEAIEKGKKLRADND